MLLAPFLWIFCEFDEKVLDNSFRVVLTIAAMITMTSAVSCNGQLK